MIATDKKNHSIIAGYRTTIVIDFREGLIKTFLRITTFLKRYARFVITPKAKAKAVYRAYSSKWSLPSYRYTRFIFTSKGSRQDRGLRIALITRHYKTALCNRIAYTYTSTTYIHVLYHT